MGLLVLLLFVAAVALGAIGLAAEGLVWLFPVALLVFVIATSLVPRARR